MLSSTSSFMMRSCRRRVSMSGDVAAGDVGGGAGDAGVEEHQVRLQLGERGSAAAMTGSTAISPSGWNLTWLQPAVGRHHLVLRADRLLEHVLLEVDALAGELVLGRHLAAEGVQGVQAGRR